MKSSVFNRDMGTYLRRRRYPVPAKRTKKSEDLNRAIVQFIRWIKRTIQKIKRFFTPSHNDVDLNHLGSDIVVIDQQPSPLRNFMKKVKTPQEELPQDIDPNLIKQTIKDHKIKRPK